MLKAQLLKRFRLTEGGYRKRFKTGKLEPGETPAQFAERLKRYLEKWPVLSQHKKDILYRKYTSKQGDTKIQLVVPTEMREKVVSVAHVRYIIGRT